MKICANLVTENVHRSFVGLFHLINYCHTIGVKVA